MVDLDDCNFDAGLDQGLGKIKGNFAAACKDCISDALLCNADLSNEINGIASL